MSPDVSINPPILEEFDPPEPDRDSTGSDVDLVGDGTLPMDYYANSLMDDLFAEVDRMLDGGSLPAELPEPSEVVSLQPIEIPHLHLSPLLMPPSELAPLDSAELETATLEPPVVSHPSLLNRWLLAAACASAIAAVISWLVFLKPAAPPSAPTASTAPAPANQQFLSYVQRSLDAIAHRTEAQRTVAASPTVLPSVAVASNAPTAATSPAPVNRVYVPVYQPPQTLYPQPAASVPTAIAPTAPVAAAPAARPAAPVPQAAPTSVAPAAAAPVAVAPSVPAVSHTLVGLMQLGDRSAALFEVNGAAQRIYIGESIGSSGWTLVSVSNEEAVIRRNGEVRSIYVGQQF